MKRRFPAVMILLAAFFLFAAGRSFISTKSHDKKKKADQKKGCDTAKLLRTSQDKAILDKYIKIYNHLGGLCYIIQMQHEARLKQTSDSTYSVKINDKGDPKLREMYQTFLFCPIGKPNGKVALVMPKGDTVQLCTYKNEMKNGLMVWYSKNKIVYWLKFINDQQKVKATDTLTYDGN